MFPRSVIRLLLSLGACAALAPPAAAQTAASAEAIYKQAAQQHAAAIKADFAASVVALRAGLAELVAALQDGSVEAPAMPAELADLFATAFKTASDAMFEHAVALDSLGTFLNLELVDADPDTGAPAGLVVGAGGALDDYHRKLQLALASLDKSFGRELRRALHKARKLLPESAILTGQLFPMPVVAMANPGLDETPPQTTFFPRAPLFLAGYGDENERQLAVLGLSSGLNIDMNVYDADGNHLQTLDTTPLFFGQFHVASAPVPEGAQEPHGNLRIEMFADACGWTASIGY